MSLDRLIGSWNISMLHVAMTEPVHGRQVYEQVLDDAFIMLRWTYEHPDFPDAIALLDANKVHYFDVRGVTRVFDFHVDGVGWTMIRRDEDFWQRSSARFISPDEMQGVGENSYDAGVTWQHDFQMSYVRVR